MEGAHPSSWGFQEEEVILKAESVQRGVEVDGVVACR